MQTAVTAISYFLSSVLAAMLNVSGRHAVRYLGALNSHVAPQATTKYARK